MANSSSACVLRRIAFGAMVFSPMAIACATSAREQPISEDYKICATDLGELDIKRYDIIDVEKILVSWRNGRPFVEFVFSEMGIGAYTQMIRDSAASGVVLRSGSNVVVYGQLFQPDGLFFIARSHQDSRGPVWIYAKFSGSVTSDAQVAAMRVMSALESCAQ